MDKELSMGRPTTKDIRERHMAERAAQCSCPSCLKMLEELGRPVAPEVTQPEPEPEPPAPTEAE